MHATSNSRVHKNSREGLTVTLLPHLSMTRFLFCILWKGNSSEPKQIQPESNLIHRTLSTMTGTVVRDL
jgi:hypothetical protein